jgi:hypothetical protein
MNEKTSPSSEQIAAIEGNVRLVQTTVRDRAGHDLPPGREGVEFIDTLIDQRRKTRDASTSKNLIEVLACYLGASVIAAYGGRWVCCGEWGLGVEVTPELTVFPFAKTEKHFSEGATDSVLSFFDTIEALHKLPEEGTPIPRES